MVVVLIKLTEGPDGLTFSIRVQPRAAKNEITGEHDGALRLRLTAPPVEGAANKLCQSLLADWLGVPRSQVTIIAGEKSRNKVVRVAGVTRAAAVEKFALLTAGPARA